MARRTLKNLDNRILKKVIAHGADKGPEKISTKKIAMEIGITEPTIYVHFGTKNNLLREAYEKAFDNAYGGIHISEDPHKALASLGEYMERGVFQAINHPEDVLYCFKYRNSTMFMGPIDPDEDPLKNLKNLVMVVYKGTPGINNAIDQFVSDLAIRTVDSFLVGVVNGRYRPDEGLGYLLAAYLKVALEGFRESAKQEVPSDALLTLENLPPIK